MSEPISFAKMAADLDQNPKVRRAGRNGREVYLFVLRRVAALRAQGVVPVSNVDPGYVSDILQMTEDEAEAGLTACLRPWRSFGGGEEPGLLEIRGGEVFVCGWSDDWGRSPMTGAERQERYQSRKKAQLQLPAHAAVTAGDAAVTASDASDAAVTAADESDASDGSDQIRLDQREGEARAGARPPTKSALPGGWAPGPDDPNTHAALEAKARGVDVEHALAKFREHQVSKAGTAADWDAAWRKWLLQEHATPQTVIAATARVDRERHAKAARERERGELAQQRHAAQADRAEVQRIARAAVTNNFQVPVKATG